MNDFSKKLDEIRKKMMSDGTYYILPGEPEDITPNYSHINNGYCGSFSGAVCEVYGDKVKELSEKYIKTNKKLYEHWFIKYQDKFYDAECIEGVDCPKKLPIFRDIFCPTILERIKNLFIKK
ncbi:MAG: hypothetical protein WC523_03810 [Patescibacteria group bacterium]